MAICDTTEQALLAMTAYLKIISENPQSIDLTNANLTIDNAGVITELGNLSTAITDAITAQTVALSAKQDEVIAAIQALTPTQTLTLSGASGTGVNGSFGGAGVESVVVSNEDAALDCLVDGRVLAPGHSIPFTRTHLGQTLPMITVDGTSGAEVRVDVLTAS